MDGSRVILECLIKEGVDTIFGYPGGAVIPLYDALYDYTDKLKHVRTSHEQGAVQEQQMELLVWLLHIWILLH